uniref:Uncharacterized protein n=1 Tax=Anguilla anguilla TaxID=7936 RepID=A0A0E9TSJ7_ANGAN
MAYALCRPSYWCLTFIQGILYRKCLNKKDYLI